MIIVGRCEHGLVVAAAVEGRVSPDFLIQMSTSYSLERQPEPVTMEHCARCAERVQSNLKLIRMA